MIQVRSNAPLAGFQRGSESEGLHRKQAERVVALFSVDNESTVN